METIIHHKTIAIMLAKEMKPLGNEVLSPNGEQINVFVDVETHYLDFKIHMKKNDKKVNGPWENHEEKLALTTQEVAIHDYCLDFVKRSNKILVGVTEVYSGER